jgi:2,4-dienoyl-CoA reductase (NADPH2)
MVRKTNHRSDEYGGENFGNRMRLALDIVKETRKACGLDFIIIFRLSMLDLVKDGSSWEEIKALAQALEDAGVTIINTGIGWHEARIRKLFCGIETYTDALRSLAHLSIVST